MKNNKGIMVKAMCLLVDNQRVLVAEGNSMKSDVRLVVARNFYRVLGGSVEFDETAEQAVRREIKEEVNSEVENLEMLGVTENRFTYAGERGHEIVFMFKGTLARKELTGKEIIHVVESDCEFDAIWVPFKEILKGDKPLYPEFDYKKYLI